MDITVHSFLFGVTLAISVGPIAMLIMTRSINCGLRAGILTGATAALADLTYALISFLAGSGIYMLFMEFKLLLQIFSSLVLVLFGSWMIIGAFRNRNSRLSTSGSSCKRIFASTYVLTILNPLTIVAFIGFATQHAIENGIIALISSIALFAGSLVIQLVFAFFGNILKQWMSSPSAFLYLNTLSGSLIIGMGLMKFLPLVLNLVFT